MTGVAIPANAFIVAFTATTATLNVAVGGTGVLVGVPVGVLVAGGPHGLMLIV